MLEDKIILEHCGSGSRSLDVLNATKEIERSFPDIKRAKILKVTDAVRVITLDRKVIGYLCFVGRYCFVTTKEVTEEQLPALLHQLLPKPEKTNFFLRLFSRFGWRKRHA